MNARIRHIGIYHPENKVGNEFYLEHFKKQGKDIERLLSALGRKERFISNDENENSLTLGHMAVLNALQETGLQGSDFDCICFSSQCPEYLFPSQAVILHGLIEGKQTARVFDINVNCIGMTTAVDMVSKIMKTDPSVKRALVVGADKLSSVCNKEDELTYPVFGDLGCAVILEATDEPIGIMDTEYRTDGKDWKTVNFPANGLSKKAISNEPIGFIDWTPFNGDFIIDHMEESMHVILERNNMKLDDIKAFCFSQFAQSIPYDSADRLGVPREKFMYVGDKYGYTGTSSPFLALREAMVTGVIQPGDTVSVWAMGIHWTTCHMLIKF